MGNGDDHRIGPRQLVPGEKFQAVLGARCIGVRLRVMHGHANTEGLQLAHDVDGLRIADVAAVLLEREPEQVHAGTLDTQAGLHDALDRLLGR